MAQQQGLAGGGVIRHEVTGISFSFYKADEVRQMSAKHVTNPSTFDLFGNPVSGGLYDRAMGPTSFSERCQTCHQPSRRCPGHIGHVELPLPVYHPLLFPALYTILKCVCFNCNNFKMAKSMKDMFLHKLQLLQQHKLVAAMEFEEAWRMGQKKVTKATVERDGEEEKKSKDKNGKKSKSPEEKAEEDLRNVIPPHAPWQWHLVGEKRETLKAFIKSMPTRKCSNCGHTCPSLYKNKDSKIFQKGTGTRRKHGGGSGFERMKYLPPLEVFHIFQKMWMNELHLVDIIWNQDRATELQLERSTGKKKRPDPHGFEMFFLTVLPVPPNRYRPISKAGDMVTEHAQNNYLSKVLTINNQLGDLATGKADEDAKKRKAAQKKKGGAARLAPLSSDEDEDMEAGSSDDDGGAKKPMDIGRTMELWVELQENVNYLMDNKNAPLSLNAPPGVKQILEKKEVWRLLSL
tara:strand:- start:1031 stop:2413 length:1383 start_codon:yes stop_codon:yes gene_type:complete